MHFEKQACVVAGVLMYSIRVAKVGLRDDIPARSGPCVVSLFTFEVLYFPIELLEPGNFDDHDDVRRDQAY